MSRLRAYDGENNATRRVGVSDRWDQREHHTRQRKYDETQKTGDVRAGHTKRSPGSTETNLHDTVPHRNKPPRDTVQPSTENVRPSPSPSAPSFPHSPVLRRAQGHPSAVAVAREHRDYFQRNARVVRERLQGHAGWRKAKGGVRWGDVIGNGAASIDVDSRVRASSCIQKVTID